MGTFGVILLDFCYLITLVGGGLVAYEASFLASSLMYRSYLATFYLDFLGRIGVSRSEVASSSGERCILSS